MPILTNDEIMDLYSRYQNVVDFIQNQNQNYPPGQKIKQVQIPSSLTQSIVFHYILNHPNSIGLNNVNENQLIQGNNRTYDLIYNGIQIINIEVKATGTNEFQRFRPHALTAHCVFWLNFHNNNQFDLAIFSPNILNPNNSGEVTINWQNLMNNYGINILHNNYI